MANRATMLLSVAAVGRSSGLLLIRILIAWISFNLNFNHGVTGFPEVSFTAALAQDSAIGNEASRTISGWTVQNNGGFTSIGVSILSDGSVEIPRDGIYVVAANLLMEVAEYQTISLYLVVNGRPEESALVARETTANGATTLKVSGLLKLYRLSKIHLQVYSSGLKGFSPRRGITLKAGSTFSGSHVSSFNSQPAMLVGLVSDLVPVEKDGGGMFSWESGRRVGSFTQGIMGFTPSRTVVSITTSGFYFVAANIIVAKVHGACAYKLEVVVNEATILIQTLQSGPAKNGTLTINLAGSVHLNINDRLSLRLTSDGSVPSFARSHSSFSVGRLFSENKSIRGMSLASSQGAMITNDGWLKVDFEKYGFTAGNGGFLSSHAGVGIPVSRFTASKEGFYLVTANIYIRALEAISNIRIACMLNGIPIKETDGTLTATMPSHLARHVTLGLAGLVYMGTGDYLSFFIKHPYANPWNMERGSTVSVLRLVPSYAACGVGLTELVTVPTGQWQLLKAWSDGSDGTEFEFGSAIEAGEYTVSQSGVHLVASNVLLANLSNAVVEASLITDGKMTNAIDGFYAKETAVSGSVTLHIEGALVLTKGTRLAVSVKANQQLDLKIIKGTSLSVVFIGKDTLSRGFHTTLGQSIIMKTLGWHRVERWNEPRSRSTYAYSNGRGFSALSGVYKVDETALYHVAFTVLLSEVNIIETGAEFAAFLSIDDADTSETLIDRRGERVSKAFAGVSAEITLHCSGFVKLTAGQSITVKVGSKRDQLFVVSGNSGFSVVMMTLFDTAHVDGLMAAIPRLQLTNQLPWRTLSGWSTVGSSSGRFASGSGVQVLDGTKFIINKNSIYCVSVKLEMLHLENTKVFLKIFVSGHSTAIDACAVSSLGHVMSSLGCTKTMYLKAGSEISARVSSSGGVVTPLVFTSSGFVSVFRVMAPRDLPAVQAFLAADASSTYQLQSISGWLTVGRARFAMDSPELFRPAEGKITSPITGWYLISSVIAMKNMKRGILEIGLAENGALNRENGVRLKTENRETLFGVFFATAIELKKGDYTSLQLSSTNTEAVVDSRSFLSASFLPSNGDAMNYRAYLSDDLSYGSEHVVAVRGWKTVGTGQLVNSFLATESNIYLLSTHVLYKLAAGSSGIQLQTNVGGKLTHVAAMDDGFGGDVRTISMCGVLLVEKAAYLSTQLVKNTSETIDILQGSTLSFVSLGLTNQVSGMLGMAKTHVLSNQRSQWLMATFGLGYKHDLNVVGNTAIVMTTGLYHIAVNYLLSVAASTNCMAALFVNGQLTRLAITKYINRHATLSIAATVELQQGMFLEPKLRCERKGNLNVMENTNWHVLMIGNQDRSSTSHHAPVVIADIATESSKMLYLGEKFELKCVAGGAENIKYQWIFNGEMINGATDSVHNVFGSKEGIGSYECQVSANGLRSFSNSVKVDVFDNDECSTVAGVCSQPNQTCINTIGAYKCECVQGFTLRGGQCSIVQDAPKYQVSSNTEPASVAVRVLVPIACIILVFVVVLGLYTLRKHRKAKTYRTDRHHLTDIVAIPEDDTPSNSMLPSNTSEYELADNPYDADGGFGERTLPRDSTNHVYS